MIKMKESGLKFGRTWVDRIMGKVDKDQGVANAGKVLGIGDDGQVVPVEQSGGGGSSFPYVEVITNLDASELSNKIKQGDNLIVKVNYTKFEQMNISDIALEAVGDLKKITGTITTGLTRGTYTAFLTCDSVDSNGTIKFSQVPIFHISSILNTTVDGITIYRACLGNAVVTSLSSGYLRSYSDCMMYAYSDDTSVIPRVSHKTDTGSIKTLNGFIIHNS